MLVITCLVLFTSLDAARAETHWIPAPATYTIRDGQAMRVLGVQDGFLVHTAISNLFTGRPRYISAREFGIELRGYSLGPEDCTVKEAVQERPGRLRLTLSTEAVPLSMELFYEAAPGSFFIRKWLEIRPLEGNTVFIEKVIMEEFEPWAEAETFSGPGQPVYVENTFWGVEYPAAHNGVRDGRVVCEYDVGLTIGPEPYITRSSVFGVSEQGKVSERFLQYIAAVRGRPVQPFLLYNTWYDLRNYSAAEVVDVLAGLRQGLVEPYGIKLDSVVLDDGWDDFHNLWLPDPQRFPHGFATVREAAGELGAGVGLWMSPLGGYTFNQWMRIFHSRGTGLEKSPQGFCIAGPKYNQWFKDRMIQYVREEAVNYFKLDNLTTFCNNPRHGHRTGRYGLVGLTDAFIAIMDEVKKENPGVMINITRGAWMSPWWLLHADVVWRGGMDYGFKGQGTKRQRAITYVDSILYKRYHDEGAQFPLNSVMTHGLIKARLQDFGEHGENLRDFSDDAWMYFSRGVMMQELYLSAQCLSPKEMEVLARVIKFAHEHYAALSQSRMILGSPDEGEIYGFLGVEGTEAVLALRNPVGEEREAEIPWAALLGDDLRKRFLGAEVVYSAYLPRVQEISSLSEEGQSVVLQPLETRVLLFHFQGQ